jgi:hypothetical protein
MVFFLIQTCQFWQSSRTRLLRSIVWEHKKMIAGSLAQSNTRGVMHRAKLPVKLRENIMLLAWALALTLVLSLILFGCMFVAAYVADEISLTQ